MAERPGRGRMAANLADAITLWRSGREREAEQACTALLTARGDPSAAHGLLAAIYSARGQFRAASEQLQRLAERHPHDAAGWRRLGDAQFGCDEFAAAVASFRRAIELEPTHPRAHNNLGRALARLAEYSAGIQSYRRALELDPHYAIAHNNLGMALAESGELEHAVACYERAIELNPGFAEAHSNRGNVLLRLDRAEDALASFERALALIPANATVLCNCGNALVRLNRLAGALACFDRALQLAPDFPLALRGRADALKVMRRYDEALALYERVGVLQPGDLEARCNLAGILLDQERYEAAVEACDQILYRQADFIPALLVRGLAQHYRGGAHYTDAIQSFAQLCELAPDTLFALGLLIHSSSMIADWSLPGLGAEVTRRTRADQPAITPLALLAVNDDAALQLQCARTCISTTHPASSEPLWRGARWHNPKLRLAYISGDLREHALSRLMVGVFEQHDRARFEILGISLREPIGTPFGARVLSSFDVFLDVSGQADRQVAHLLHEMKVDIAIDLMGVTRGNRLDILAHRPAPLQVTYLGYPGTTGAPYIDYLLADEFLIPDASRCHYSENIVYLPECFQANDDRRPVPGGSLSRADAGLPTEALVLCSFNNCYKITPQIFALWCRLLAARPRAVLWLLAESALAQHNLRQHAMDSGIDPERLVFAERVSYEEYLARLQLADLFLDSFPFNAGATASDALWMGLPVLSCSGESFSSRMAGSLLQSLDLAELIAPDLQGYERIALQLADSPQTLQALRARLIRNRSVAPVFDTKRACRHLEDAYATMQERHIRGEPPAHFRIVSRASPILVHA
jgi:protein O-GlcNAc transferase